MISAFLVPPTIGKSWHSEIRPSISQIEKHKLSVYFFVFPIFSNFSHVIELLRIIIYAVHFRLLLDAQEMPKSWNLPQLQPSVNLRFHDFWQREYRR